MKHLSSLLALGAVLAASSTMAFATIIPAGTSDGTPYPPDLLTPVPVAGTSNSISGTLNSSTGSFSATYTETEFVDSSNALCGTGNCITFELAITSSSSSPGDFDHISLGPGFNGYTDDIGYVPGTGNVSPNTIDETPGGVVDFDFYGADLIAPGDTVSTLVIETSATNFAQLGIVTADDGGVSQGNAFIPTAATPEPNSLLLLGTGLIGAAGLLFMRRRNAANLL